MKVLIDTNLLTRLAVTSDPQHAIAIQAILKLDQADCEIWLIPQVLYEYWVVATRPVEVNGLGMSPTAVGDSLRDLIDTYELHRDEGRVFDLWQQLVSTHAVKGKNAHDARIVAAMLCHGLTTLVTFNTPDFARFTGINVFSPADVLNGLLTT